MDEKREKGTRRPEASSPLGTDRRDSSSRKLQNAMSWEAVMGDKSTLLVGDCPSGLEFGIDCMTYETGQMFKGITVIPRGIHFIYYSCGNFQREGYFVSVADPIHAVYWDKVNERIKFEISPSPEVLRQRQAELLSGALNKNLAPYPQKHYQSWVLLTTRITVHTLQRCHCIPYELLLPDCEDLPLPPSAQSLSTSAPAAPPNEASFAVFSPIKALESRILSERHKSGPENLTTMGMDKSWLLEHLAASFPAPCTDSIDEILGELQLSFVLFMLLHSYGGLQQWKLLLTTICEAHTFLLQHTDFTLSFIQLLHTQLKYIPQDFFEDELISKDNFLAFAFQALFSCLHTSQDKQVIESRQRLATFLCKKFDWLHLTDASQINLHPDPIDATSDVDHYSISSSAHQGSRESARSIDESTGEAEKAEQDDSFKKKWSAIHASLNAIQEQHPQLPLSSLSEGLAELLVGGQSSSVGDGASPMDTSDANNNRSSSGLWPLIAPSEQEGMKFCWRYPLLYEQMIQARGTEDMIMTAMRLLDDPLTPALLQNECVAFIENECADQSN